MAESVTQLQWLQEWFARRCDGRWEHQHGVTIDTLDNPGWSLRVDLAGSSLEGRPFEPIESYITDDEWLACRIEEGAFLAACGPRNLERAIQVFRDWAESASLR